MLISISSVSTIYFSYSMQMIIHQNRAMNEKAPPLFLRCQAIDKSAFTFLFTERRIFLLAVHALNSFREHIKLINPTTFNEIWNDALKEWSKIWLDKWLKKDLYKIYRNKNWRKWTRLQSVCWMENFFGWLIAIWAKISLKVSRQ